MARFLKSGLKLNLGLTKPDFIIRAIVPNNHHFKINIVTFHKQISF